jgi:hypothetical protein
VCHAIRYWCLREIDVPNPIIVRNATYVGAPGTETRSIPLDIATERVLIIDLSSLAQAFGDGVLEQLATEKLRRLDLKDIKNEFELGRTSRPSKGTIVTRSNDLSANGAQEAWAPHDRLLRRKNATGEGV